MPSRHRSDLRCTENTLTRTVSALGQHSIVAQCEERVEQREQTIVRVSTQTAVVGEREQRRTIVCVFKESDGLWGLRRRRSSSLIRVELQQELAYRSERTETKTQRLGIQCGWYWLSFAPNGARIATPRLMLNRCQSMSTIKSSMTSRVRQPDWEASGIGDAATPRGEKITRHGRVWRTFPSAVASHLNKSFK